MGLAGVVIVVLAALTALVAPVPAAAVVPGTNGLIAFVSSRDRLDSGFDIYVMNADGTNPTRLTTDGSSEPVFSPDGKRIAFRCPRGGNYEICLMNADGSNPVNLTNNPAYDAEPNWGVLAAQPTATTTTLDVTPASPAAANTVQTLTATATPSGSAGTVQFKDGTTTTIGNPVTVTNGTATLTTTLRAGTHALTAVFTPNDPTKSGSSTSATVSYVVDVATGARATTTTLTVFPTPAFRGIPVVFLAHVTPRGAAGTIQIMDGATALGSPRPAAPGFAVFITTLPAGTHTLTAVFTPTNPGAFAPSTSAPVSLAVNASSW